ncbi:MAG TPA: twin-arginine translocation signal domain-containing protein [Candidatus Aminicenantes bacterium]|nr:twin-arginine translocation signal domain-containing protein [Candidatus Aminicenantes bacterium]HRY64958.1 twin-arginine translocation signal domain-containing protein [Candidatus Aminicenantes bacterium]HRZ71871.1 twin-arginine translocation signal domain-containing protein [Candidatus Aminicenantes bacterium]
MNTKHRGTGCPGCPLSRRRFLTTAASAGALGVLAPAGLFQACSKTEKLRIRIVYALHAVVQPGPDWPNVGFDFRPVMDRTAAALRRAFPGWEFLTSMAKGEEEARKILAGDAAAPPDGYVVVQLNCWNRVVQTVAASGRPTLYVDFQYGGSGGFLVYTAEFLRQNAPNLGFVASSRPEDLAAACRAFAEVKRSGRPAEFAGLVAAARRAATPGPGDPAVASDAVAFLAAGDCLKKMKESRILAVGGGWPGIAPAVKEGLGIDVVNVPFAKVNEAWAAADKDEARAVADRWAATAAKVEGVTPETLLTSAAMYLGQKAVLKEHGANAITINCLGGFYGGHIHAYPCLGFHELLNEGLVGACECDVRSTATMVALTTLTNGRPGYISDPVIDTSRREIIYAHCVASNRPFGPGGPANPFEILTHSEDRQGASVRSILPAGYMTTTVEASPERRLFLFHQARTVGNSPDDRACRTKLAAEPVGDIEKLFAEWDQWGWHRVTVYGDLRKPVFELAGALGWKVLEEA